MPSLPVGANVISFLPRKRLNVVDCAIGKRIREARTTRLMSTQELALRLKCKPMHVQKLESGDVSASADELFRLADNLRVGVKYFFSDT